MRRTGRKPAIQSSKHPREARSKTALVSELMRVLITVPWDQKRGGLTAVANTGPRLLLRHGDDVVFFYPGDSPRAAERVPRHGFRGCDMRPGPPLIEDRRLRSLVAFWTF